MVKLHLGCGKRDFGPSWVHIDKADFPHIKYKDVTKLPFETGTVDVIYACHLIAYFDREEIIPILKEWKRVLIPGGVLRLATPDFRAMAKMYLRENCSNLNQFLGPLYGKMEGIYHKTTYDLYSLIELLASVGFKDIRKYDRFKTDHARHDDHSAAMIEGNLISLNIQCYA
jgi:predicted SAM-dependent methyltransferase